MHPPTSNKNIDSPNATSALVGASLAWKQEKSERVSASRGGGKDNAAAVDAASLAGRMRTGAQSPRVALLSRPDIKGGVDEDVVVPRPERSLVALPLPHLSTREISPLSLSTMASTPNGSTRLARGRSTPLLKATPTPTNSSNANLHQLEPLTNAIIAGSLASLRITPHHTDLASSSSITPSRPKLLQTLRQPAGPADEEEESFEKHKSKRVHHHHGKLRKGRRTHHHEGSRSIWREEISPRERKRYEGLWASNRGYLLSRRGRGPVSDMSESERDDDDDDDNNNNNDNNDGASHCVANVVVREIWKRSRLPTDELAEIWDLVDRQGKGMLSRQEFVVGTWLVDQRLKGRKVPARVKDSVWGSANGVSMRRPRGRWRE